MSSETWRVSSAFAVISGVIINACMTLILGILLMLISWKLALVTAGLLFLISQIIQRLTRQVKRLSVDATSANASQIASDHLQLMVSALMADSTLDAVHCGWQRIYACGAVGSPHFGSDDANLFRHFAFHCHFAIHACLMRREIALEIGCAEGHFTICLAPKVQRLRSIDISIRALKRAEERCAALHNVTFQRLDLDLEVIPGTFDLIVCNEVLYYLRGWRDIVARLLRQLRPGGFFLTTHSRLLVDDPESTGFAWHESFTFGVENIAKIIAAQPAVALRRELRTPLYRVLLYERFSSAQTLDPPEVVKSNQMGQMTPLAEEFARWPRRPLVKFGSQKASAVPILMYHRIAAEGPPGLERYRVAPDLFAAQMAILHRAGYRAIELEDWIKALLRDEPLFGRPMVLTFDDGYRDFLTAATPVLRLFGFPATVFLVAGRMGGMSDWDASYGDPAPLLSWEEVHALRDVGIGFGCHSLVHQLMTGMSLEELAGSTSRRPRNSGRRPRVIGHDSRLPPWSRE